MPWNKSYFRKARLYVILDREVSDYDRLFEILKQAVPAGAGVFQLRDKRGSAREILEFSQKAIKFLKGRVPFIINDRIDLAVLAGADGVHLGQEDIPIELARRMLKRGKCIGISCQTLQQAIAAEKWGADYIGFGSVFKTLTKPERNPMNLKLLQQVVRRIKIPVFAIGGINAHNVRQLDQLGVQHIAVCRDIGLSKNIAASVKHFLNKDCV